MDIEKRHMLENRMGTSESWSWKSITLSIEYKAILVKAIPFYVFQDSKVFLKIQLCLLGNLTDQSLVFIFEKTYCLLYVK